MTGPATAGTITPVTVTGGDDGIPPDLLLQSKTYISAETNARFKTAKPNKADFVVEEGKEVDLATSVSVKSKSKMEVHKVNRSVKVNVKRPSWLSEDWKFERKFCTNGASARTVDNYYYEPVSGKKFRSMPEVLRFLKTGSMRKKSTGGNATVILSQVRAAEAVTNAYIGVGCLYCTILGVAHEV
ncbi:Methyl-CpG-binding domain-containing protein 5 [Capsicum chinense]|nr:Methyl-CpG-binding domain-containing protein 5 [Capsicum chinense]